MSGGRFFDGKSWTDVLEYESSFRGTQRPIPPIQDGDGKIFVSIPSFRDGKRCAETLADLFSKAKDPDSIVVGLIEQNYEEDDPTCLETYCKDVGGMTIYRRERIRADTTKIIAKDEERASCPRIGQIRKLAVHNVAAKGPSWARSLGRKLLGNEEYCLQIDAHTKFVPEWDAKVKQEWLNTANEFGIISVQPPGLGELRLEVQTIPRSCTVHFLENGIPWYGEGGDGKVENLSKPLLSHTWSPGFSFAKCHLEESAPYDGLAPFVAGVEGFARYARFWTRGYDVYTPTQNIVYHNYQPQPDGHGFVEWMKARQERVRDRSIKRIKSFLELPGGLEGFRLDNLGVYGIGKRRSLKQMAEFVGVDLENQRGRPVSLPCGNFQWVPYDPKISPIENLYSNPDDLDSQPEFPLRTEMTFYQQIDAEVLDLEVLEGDLHPAVKGGGSASASGNNDLHSHGHNFPSATLLLVLWVFGLIAWAYYALSIRQLGTSRIRKRVEAVNNYKNK